MSNGGDTFNFGGVTQTASGDGAVNQVGNNTATTTVNNGDELPKPEQVLEAIAAELPPEVVEDTIEPLQSFAAMPIATMEAVENKPKWSNLLERLTPFAPQIGKGLATFSAAALEALALRNPVVAGVLALCKANAA